MGDRAARLPADTSTWTSGDDLPSLRLQRWVPPLLPLPPQAVVCWQVGLVLPALRPWLPDHGSAPLIVGPPGRREQTRTGASSPPHLPMRTTVAPSRWHPDQG